MTDVNQLPFSAEAEEAVIGAALIDTGVVNEVMLSSAEFYFEKNRWIWRAIRKIVVSGGAPDYVAVIDELTKTNKLSDIGGSAYLTKLINLVPSSLRAKQYAEIVKDKAKRRKAIQLAGDLAQAAFNENGNFDESIGDITLKLTETTHTSRGMVHISEVMNEVIKYVEERAKTPDEVWGVPTGFIDLDRLTGGVLGTWFIAGPPGVGKSILMLQMIINAAKDHGKKGAIFSLEMSRLSQGLRVASSLAEIPTRALRTGYLSDDDWTAFFKGVQIAADLPIYICDEPELSTQQFRSHMTRLKAQNEVDIYGLDYLFLLTDAEGKESTERTEVLSKRIVSIAKSLDVPGVTINSVTKEGMNLKAPKSTNIRGSGQMIHDADVIMFITKDPLSPNIRKLDITKGRDFEDVTETVELIKTGTWPSFQDISYQQSELP